MRLYTDSLLSALKLQKSLRLIFKHHMLEIFTVFSEFKEFRSSLVGLVLLFVFLFCFHVTPEHFSSWQTSSGRDPAGLVPHILCTVGSPDFQC